tara:strand:+ start:450 stop:2867 length:2418 start_codon:yes stop_codon:yes gene_type:complete
MRAFCLTLLLIFSYSLFSQSSINGKVIDAKSKEPLAFVNIVINESNRGFSTDIDGKFKLKNPENIQSLKFSYLGYETVNLTMQELNTLNFRIELQQNTYQLKEIEILPGENPAHRIIDAVIANKNQNNPEIASDFYYESYNKLIFSARPDSIYEKLPDSVKAKDSASIEEIKFLEKQHFLIMESVTERNHIPPTHSKEVVTASRISGLKTPFFSLIGTQLQSFSLYSTYIQLFSYSYLSPISNGSTSKYLFVLEDTIFQGKDTVYSISFRPRKGKFFDGLKGVLTINSDAYAVQNFIAETIDNKDLSVKIQQNYEKINEIQWFPVQLNTFFIFKNLDIDNFDFYGEGKSYIKNIELKSRLTKKELGNVVLKMGEDAGKKDSSYWQTHRIDSLTNQETNTYHFMDSVGEKINLDQKLFIYQALFSGAFPIGPVDLRLNRLMDFNRYEGFRLGLGAETNDRISKQFRIGGYGAYGFKDKAWKYGGHLKWKRKHDTHLSAKISYANDLVESGGSFFYNDWINPFSTETFYKFFIIDMDQVEKFDFELETHAVRDFQTTFFANHQIRSINSPYRFNPSNELAPENLSPDFRLTEAGVNIRFAFREKFVEMFGIKTPISYQYPIVHLKITRGFKGIAQGEFDYNRVDLKVQKLFRLRNLGLTSLRLTAGYIDASMPITNLFRMRGTEDDELLFAADFNFQTATPNEFFHDQYLNFFFKHSFKNLLFRSKNFNPELALVSNVGWGSMRKQENHENFEFSTMRKGFFESGIQIDRLLGFLNLGVGAYYRYGAYSLPSQWDNVFYKLTSSVKF